MLREQIEEFLEMIESDYEGMKNKASEQRTAAILKNYIADLKEILNDTENE